MYSLAELQMHVSITEITAFMLYSQQKKLKSFHKIPQNADLYSQLTQIEL